LTSTIEGSLGVGARKTPRSTNDDRRFWSDAMAKSSHQVLLSQLLRSPSEVSHRGWVPAADVYELHSGWMIKVELAGIRPEDVTVTLDGDVLRVVGHRRDWVVHETQNCHSLEISYARFERRFRLPRLHEKARIVTDYRDGMLLVKVLSQ
jgi:HSP20 family protein